MRPFLPTIRFVGLCLLLWATCTGCIIIPTNYYTSDSRKNVQEETTSTIIPGQTTKRDIFLALGEPDEVSPDGRRLVYHWSKVYAVWAMGMASPSGASGGAGTIGRKYDLIITFDGTDVVSQREFQGKWQP